MTKSASIVTVTAMLAWLALVLGLYHVITTKSYAPYTGNGKAAIEQFFSYLNAGQ